MNKSISPLTNVLSELEKIDVFKDGGIATKNIENIRNKRSKKNEDISPDDCVYFKSTNNPIFDFFALISVLSSYEGFSNALLSKYKESYPNAKVHPLIKSEKLKEFENSNVKNIVLNLITGKFSLIEAFFESTLVALYSFTFIFLLTFIVLRFLGYDVGSDSVFWGIMSFIVGIIPLFSFIKCNKNAIVLKKEKIADFKAASESVDFMEAINKKIGNKNITNTFLGENFNSSDLLFYQLLRINTSNVSKSSIGNTILLMRDFVDKSISIFENKVNKTDDDYLVFYKAKKIKSFLQDLNIDFRRQRVDSMNNDFLLNFNDVLKSFKEFLPLIFSHCGIGAVARENAFRVVNERFDDENNKKMIVFPKVKGKLLNKMFSSINV